MTDIVIVDVEATAIAAAVDLVDDALYTATPSTDVIVAAFVVVGHAKPVNELASALLNK